MPNPFDMMMINLELRVGVRPVQKRNPKGRKLRAPDRFGVPIGYSAISDDMCCFRCVNSAITSTQ